MARTRRGEPCPTCNGKEKTEFVAKLPLEPTPGSGRDQTIPPHEYAVGLKCYRKQFKKFYNTTECPV